MRRGVTPNSTYITALLNGQTQWIIGELYTFTSVTGQVDYFTNMDLDIVYEGVTYKGGGLRIQGLRMKLAVGISVDEQDVTIWASPTDTLFGATFLTAMAEGIMDGGTIARDRIVWTPVTGNVATDVQNPPDAVWRMFLGYMSTIEKIGKAQVQFKVKSALVKLNIDMPRNYFQPACNWSLFDDSLTTGQQGVGCTLLASNFATPLIIGASPNSVTIQPSGGVPNPSGLDGYPNYQRGRILFTSGVNNGLLSTIDSNDSVNLILAYAVSYTPSPGDTITIYPGCSKSFATCQTKFNNTANFRGYDKVPPVTVSV